MRTSQIDICNGYYYNRGICTLEECHEIGQHWLELLAGNAILVVWVQFKTHTALYSSTNGTCSESHEV